MLRTVDLSVGATPTARPFDPVFSRKSGVVRAAGADDDPSDDEDGYDHELREEAIASEFSNFHSNFWLILGKHREARSRLYRSQILQVNIRWNALDEIYQIYTLLHFGNPIEKP